MRIKTWFSVAFAMVIFSGAALAVELFSEDFESPTNVVAYSQGTLPDNGNWVGSNDGFGSDQYGMTDKAGGDFSTTNAANHQAMAFRYTNSGATTDDGVIGVLETNLLYTITLDVVRDDGKNAGTPYTVGFLTFPLSANRADCSSMVNNGAVLLAEGTGNAPTNGDFSTVSFTYRSDDTTDPAEIGKDLVIRLKGASTSAIIDNLKVETGPLPRLPYTGDPAVLIKEDFENPDVTGYSQGTMPYSEQWGYQWVGSSDGYGSDRKGIVDKDSGQFTAPDPNDQAFAFRYSNSGISSKEALIGAVATGKTVTVLFDVVRDGQTGGTAYDMRLVSFPEGAARNDFRSVLNNGAVELASAIGNAPTNGDYQSVSLTFTAEAGTHDSEMGKDMAIRFDGGGNVAIIDNVWVFDGEVIPYNPYPAFDTIVAQGGDVTLTWSNLPPNVGSDVYVDVWFGTDPRDPGTNFFKVVDAELNTNSAVVNAPTAGTYYWRVDSYLDGAPTGDPLAGNVFSFLVADTDGDGMPDEFELANTDPPSGTALTPDGDEDSDGLTNLEEYLLGTGVHDADSDDDGLNDGPEIAGAGARPPTDPLDADTDDDGLSDGAESNTGTWVSTSDTGTDPTDVDYDNDGLYDGAEDNSGIFVSRLQTGTSPFNVDTDSDGVWDWYEAVSADFTDPNDGSDTPIHAYPVADPDTGTGVTNKPVKVFIFSGQSNMVGMGERDPLGTPGSLATITQLENKFPNLVDSNNNWTTRSDVIYRGVVTDTGDEYLSPGGAAANTIGPEMGFGYRMGDYLDEPILIIKASQGNRSLSWDFLPPGSAEFSDSGTTYAGYGDAPSTRPDGDPTTPSGWYAGKQYDDCFLDESAMGPAYPWELGTDYPSGCLLSHNGAMYSASAAHTAAADTEPGIGANWSTVWDLYSIVNTADVLANFATDYPQFAAQGYEIAGLGWFQGHKDSGNSVYASRYEHNMVNFINAMREEFNATNAPFVVSTIGFHGYDMSGTYLDVWSAQMAVGNTNAYPAFAGNVSVVDTRPLWREIDESPQNQDYHYNRNAETYMLIGDAMARRFIEMDLGIPPPSPTDGLLEALQELTAHVTGSNTLTAAEIEAHCIKIISCRGYFGSSQEIIEASFDFVSAYDANIGPLWVSGSPKDGGFSRSSVAYDEHWSVYNVMQGIMDDVYNSENIANYESLLLGYTFGSASNFPGYCPQPADTGNTHTATIDATFVDSAGWDTQHWTLPARKPTGTYLAPGTICLVTVPPALVGQGLQVRVGAHYWDYSNRPTIQRIDRSSLAYEIVSTTTKVASPLGGGIYIDVPIGFSNGVVNVDITGAVRAPYFSYKSFHTTTSNEWETVERNHPAPWADFQSEKYMMQVPTDWIYNMPDPTGVMQDWDAAMDSVNDLLGFPRDRGKESFYLMVDVVTRNSVYSPGYPAVNDTYNPDGNYGGHAGSYLVRGPRTGWQTAFHEQGHGYKFPKFGGESESTVNLLYVPVLHNFGYSLDYALAASFGFEGNPSRTLDNTAVTWMTVFNFTPRKVEMATAEKAYQLKGHAKFVDIAGLYGWQPLNDFWKTYVDEYEAGTTSNELSTADDTMIFRLSKTVGKDLRPLFHFWGVFPTNPTELRDAMTAEGLLLDEAIRNRLLHYKTLVPADNAAFRTFASGWWGGTPSIGGAWTEREHTRQWDSTDYFTANGWTYGGTDPAEADGEIYNPDTHDRIQTYVQEIIDLYYEADTNTPTIVALSPADEATGVTLGANLIATFSEPIAVDTGSITIKNLTDATNWVIDVTDGSQISVSDSNLIINAANDFDRGDSYAVRIDALSIRDLSENGFQGISDDTTWNFSTTNPPPEVSFAVASASGAESNTPVTVTATLSYVFGGTVEVTHQLATSPGSATLGADYTYASDTLIFNEGETNKTFTFAVVDDTEQEGDETIIFEFGTLVNCTAGTPSTFTYTIQSDSADVLPEATFSTTSGTGPESLAAPGDVTVVLSKTYSGTTTVDYALSPAGTATQDADFTFTSGTLTFDPGVTTQSFTFAVIDDVEEEGDETVVFGFGSIGNGTAGTASNFTYTIEADTADVLPEVTFSPAGGTGAESLAAPGDVTVVLSKTYSGTTTVDYVLSPAGTATQDADFTFTPGTLTFDPGVTTQSFTFAVIDDTEEEGDETVVFGFGSIGNGTAGTASNFTYTIEADTADVAPVVNFSPATGTGPENAATATVTVVLATAYSGTTTVDYVLSPTGTATQDVDFTFSSGTLTFDPGVTNQSFTLTVIDDAEEEGDETVVFGFGSIGNGTAGAASNFTYTIEADIADVPPTVAFAEANGSGAESASGSAAVVLSHAYVGTTTVDYVLSGGTATEGDDFTFTPGTLTFNPGVTNLDFTFTVIDDGLNEEDETIVFSLATVSNGTIGAADSFIYTILSDANDWGAVPFYEPFEARTLGDLDGQRGWVSTAAVVQDTITFGGSAKAGELTDEASSMQHSFDGTESKVWMDVRLRVKYTVEAAVPPPEMTVYFYVSTNGQVMVYDGTAVVASGATVPEGVWTRFTVLSDYNTATWVLFVNGERTGRYAFYNAANPSFVKWRTTGPATYVDDLSITSVMPEGVKVQSGVILIR